MSSLDNLLNGISAETLAVTAVCGVLTAVAYLVWRARQQGKEKWVGFLPNVGWLETMHGFSSSRCPLFLRELAERHKRMTYRLNLPLSLSKGCYLVGEGPLSREILTDPTSDKSAELSGILANFFEGRLTMFTSLNNEYMRTVRKGTMHAFSKNQVARMNAVARRYCDELLEERIQKLYLGEEPFDPEYEFNRLTFRVICEAAFEYTDVTDAEYEALMEHLDASLREFVLFQLSNPLRATYLGSFLPSVQKAHQSANIVRAFARKVLKAYQENPNKSNEKTLIKLVNENPALVSDDEQKVCELVNWAIAGHDTTGYSLTNMLILLAKNPKVQEKLRQETKVTVEGDTPPQQVDYFRHVIQETSRMVPVAPFLGRCIHRDFHTKDGRVLPKGSFCFLGIYHANHDPTIFEQPDEFRPERWENPSHAMLDQHFPFAVGPRSCPGQSLAMAEIFSTMPRLLQKYSFEIVDEGALDFFLTFKIRGARLKVTKL